MKLKVNNVEFAYKSISVLENVSMELNRTEVLGIVGPNGTGKSTLIRCIDHILNPKRGSILLDDHNISKMSRMEIARKMGYVPQSLEGVFPASVIDTVLMGRRPYLGWKNSKEDLDCVLDVLELLGMTEFAMRDIKEISGGQQQKVLIARALAQKANILLLDEPTSNLDIRHQLEVMGIIKNIVKNKGISAIMVLHDLNLASRYADRIIMMKDGKIFAVGNPTSVLTVENIKEVYGVRALVKNDGENPYIIPLEPATS